MNLSRLNTFLTIWTFRSLLLKNAYSGAAIEDLTRRSRFGSCEIREEGIGFDLRLTKKASGRAGSAPMEHDSAA